MVDSSEPGLIDREFIRDGHGAIFRSRTSVPSVHITAMDFKEISRL